MNEGEPTQHFEDEISIEKNQPAEQIERLQRVIETNILFERVLYPDNHPARQYLQSLLSELIEEGEMVEVHLIKDGEIDAFACGTDSIYLTDGLCRQLPSKEAIQALLAHELSHLKNEDSAARLKEAGRNSYSTASQERLQEFRADLDSLIDLDNRGINPQGAIELQETLSNIIPVTSTELDITHGSPQIRKMNLREVMRFYDFHYLQHTTTSIDWSSLEPQEELADVNTPIETWRRLRRELTANRRTNLVKAVQTSVREYSPELSPAAHELLSAWVVSRFRNEKIIEDGLTDIPDALAELFAQDAFDKLELLLSQNDLGDIISLAAKQALRNQNESEALDSINSLKEAGLQYSERLFGDKEDFETIINTALIEGYIEQKTVINQLQASFNSQQIQIIEDDDLSTEKLMTVPAQLPAIAELDLNKLQEYLKTVGVNQFDFGHVREWLLDQLGENLKNLTYYTPGKFEDQSVYFVDNDSIREFSAYIRSAISLLTTIVNTAELPDYPTNDLADLERYTGLLGKDYYALLYSHNDELFKNQFQSRAAAVITVEEIVNNLTLHKPVGKIMGRLREMVLRLSYQDCVRLFTEVTIPSNRFRKDVATLNDLMWPAEHDLSLIKKVSKTIQEYYRDCEDNQVAPDTAVIDDIFHRAYLLTILNDEPHVKQFKQLDDLLNSAARNDQGEPLDADNPAPPEVVSFAAGLEQFDHLEQMRDQLAANTQVKILPLGSRQKLTLTQLVQANKMDALETGIQSEEEIPDLIASMSDMAKRWPQRWQAIEVEKYRTQWAEISTKIIGWLAENPTYPATDQECKDLLYCVLLAQGTASSFGATELLLKKLVDLSPTSEIAWHNLQEFDHLPLTVLQPAISRVVRDKCHLIEEYAQIEQWVKDQLEQFVLESDDAVAMELLSAATSQLYSAERTLFVNQILTTGESDREFKMWYADRWRNNLPESVSESLRDISHLGFYGELSRDPGRFQRAVQLTGQGSDNLLELSNNASFEETYQSLFRLGEVSKYLLLRDLCVSGEKYSHLFDSRLDRQSLLDNLFQHYLRYDELPDESKNTLREITEAIATTPDAYDLYYFTGPLLASLAFQYPDHPVDINEVVDDQTKKRINQLKDKARDPRDQSRTLATPGVADQTKELFRAWVWTLLTERHIDVRFDREKFKLQIEPPTDINFSRLEDYVQVNMQLEDERGYELAHNLTPIDLAVEVAENTGALGIRWLQLIGLYSTFTPQDRQKIDRMYDRVQGQDELTALRTMRREANLSPQMQELYASLVRLDGVVGGGSIVTVFDAYDHDNRKWAIGVKNPNADYKATEMANFVGQLVDHIAEQRGDHSLDATKILLQNAAEWIKTEINDPEYFTRNTAFSALNDYRSERADRFQPAPGIEWQITVPEIKDTGTDWVRWEEFVEGVGLTQARVFGEVVEGEPERWLMPAEAKQISALIIQNYLYQLLETGLVHSDIHPGNFIITPDNKVAILDRKNLLLLDEDERQLMTDVIEQMARNQTPHAVELICRHLLNGAKKEKKRQLGVKIKDQLAAKTGQPLELQVNAILATLINEGVEVPLKMFLIVKNFLGLQRISQWAHFGSLADALLYSPAGQPKDEVMRTVLPETAKRLGPKLFLLRFIK